MKLRGNNLPIAHNARWIGGKAVNSSQPLKRIEREAKSDKAAPTALPYPPARPLANKPLPRMRLRCFMRALARD